MKSAGNTRILANAEHRSTALVWRIKRDAFFEMLAGRRQRAMPQPRQTEGPVGDDSERRVMGTLRQAQQRFPELSRGVQL
jgi:hypothetical protein